MLLSAIVLGSLALQAPAVAPARPCTGAAARPARSAVSRGGVAAMKWDVELAPWKLEYGLQKPGFALPAGAEAHGAPAPFAVNDAQRKQLLEDGATIIPGLLSPEWLAYLRDITEWQVANPHVWSVAGVASGLYDYIQRSIWASNDDFAKFMYYSPLASALAGVSGAKELRLATDLLMVNPNKVSALHVECGRTYSNERHPSPSPHFTCSVSTHSRAAGTDTRPSTTLPLSDASHAW